MVSDATASEPEENAVSIEDWASTIYNRIGIVPDKELMAREIDLLKL